MVNTTEWWNIWWIPQCGGVCGEYHSVVDYVVNHSVVTIIVHTVNTIWSTLWLTECITLCSHSHSTAINWNTFSLCGTVCPHCDSQSDHSVVPTLWSDCDSQCGHTVCHRVKKCSNLSQWNDYVNTVWPHSGSHCVSHCGDCVFFPAGLIRRIMKSVHFYRNKK